MKVSFKSKLEDAKREYTKMSIKRNFMVRLSLLQQIDHLSLQSDTLLMLYAMEDGNIMSIIS